MGYRADKTSRSIVFSCEMEYPYFFNELQKMSAKLLRVYKQRSI